MSDLKLVIGEKNRSAWSLRAWLLLKQLGLEFEEIVVPLGRADTAEQILRYSPSGKLPILIAGELRVWDSLAIAETLGEHFTSLWPSAAEARAVARSVCAEVHGGFRDQQVFLPMDFTARFSPPGRLLASVAADIRRIADIWTTCRTRYGSGGPFLFGEFTIADAMFAPVCAAFTTHSIALDDLCRTYVGHVMELPAMLEWAESARGDTGQRRPQMATSPRTVELLREPRPQPAPTAWGTPFPPPPAPPAPPVIEPAPEPSPRPVASPAPSFIPVSRPAASPQPAVQSAVRPPASVPTVLPAAPTRVEPPPSPEPPEPAVEEPPLELTVLAPDEPEEEEAGPSAPGLPGVIPTRAYIEPMPEEPADAAPRRVVRPPVGSGLFRWRQPKAEPRSPEPPGPDLSVPAPARLERAPRPEPPPRSEPSPAPAALKEPQPTAAPEPVPEPAAVPAEERMPPLPASGRPVFRPGTIKPIGDGIRRRR